MCTPTIHNSEMHNWAPRGSATGCHEYAFGAWVWYTNATMNEHIRRYLIIDVCYF